MSAVDAAADALLILAVGRNDVRKLCQADFPHDGSFAEEADMGCVSEHADDLS
jgi:hypothetical protein